MALIEKMRRRAAMATGNFGKVFENIELPSLPEGSVKIASLCSQDDVDFEELTRCLEMEVSLTAALLRVANSPMFARAEQALSVKDAIVTMGTKKLSDVVLGCSVMQTVPMPETEAVDLSRFWASSVLRALTSRALAQIIDRRSESVAFTGGLLADLAIPTLLQHWSEFYEPVVHHWRTEGGFLATHEDEAFQWNHAQAGAWIARSWTLPDELVCAIGYHNAPVDLLRECELLKTPIAAVAMASLVQDPLLPEPNELDSLRAAMADCYATDPDDLDARLQSIDDEFDDVAGAFGIHAPTGGCFARLIGG